MKAVTAEDDSQKEEAREELLHRSDGKGSWKFSRIPKPDLTSYQSLLEGISPRMRAALKISADQASRTSLRTRFHMKQSKIKGK